MEQITIDLIPNGKMPMLHASQYDDGRQMRINLTENRQAYTLTGNEVLSLAVRKADNTLVTMDIANTFGGKSYVEFATTEQMCAVAGLNFGELTITNNGTKVGSLNFYLACEPSPEAGGLRSASEINNLERQVHNAVVEELEDNGAEETGYDNTESGLEATNVQDAIDEVNTKIDNLPAVDAYTKEQADEKFATKNEVPTKTSQLQNDSGFTQIDDTETSSIKAYSSEKTEQLVDGFYPIESANVGTIATFDTELEKPLVSLKTDIDYIGSEINNVVVTRCGKNLYNKNNNFVVNGYISGGKIVSSSVSKCIYLPCKPNTNYVISKILSARFVIGTADSLPSVGSDISNVGGESSMAYVPYTTNNTAKYLVVWCFASNADTYSFEDIIDTIQVEHGSIKTPYENYVEASVTVDTSGHSLYGGSLEITKTSAELISTKNSDGTDKVSPETIELSGVSRIKTLNGTNNIFSSSGNITKCLFNSKNFVPKKWANMKWVCVGDSLTEVNSRTTKHYFDYVAEKTGIAVVNMGVSGSGYAALKGDNKAFYQRISACPVDADVVTIFGSVNDVATGMQIGTYTDNTDDTIAGCINLTIDALQSVIPLTNLGIVSPTPWSNTHPFVAGVGNTYVELLKNICKYRSIPFLNLFECSNLRPWDNSFRAIAYSHDDGNGVHPDENGHKLIAPRFEAFLDGLLIH